MRAMTCAALTSRLLPASAVQSARVADGYASTDTPSEINNRHADIRIVSS